jgi:cell division protein FtsQ
MKRFFNISLSLFLLAGIVVLLGFIRNEHKKAICRGITISVDYRDGDTLMVADEIKQVLAVKHDSLEGKVLRPEHLWEFRQTISKIPYVEQCDVDFPLNGMLRVRVKQRIPILRVIEGNRSWYIDKDGIVMPRHNHFSARVLVAGGHMNLSRYMKPGNNLKLLADTNQVFAKGMLNQVIELAQYIKNNDLLSSMVEQVYVNSQNEIEIFTMVGNQRIVFGNTLNMEQKFNNLITFYRSGPMTTGLDRYRTINLKYNNQIVCSKK